MKTATKALIIGIIAGLVLLSLIVSLQFQYINNRPAVATVVADPNVNIAFMPNNAHTITITVTHPGPVQMGGGTRSG
ncbi:hypothetical protein [Sulfurisphaera ohwakuensis]|uniref:hypothetical protein n=1 Tax=Sulfurisphaera ohwakuensis TaxID=69656 RepID=UPI0036F397A1